MTLPRKEHCGVVTSTSACISKLSRLTPVASYKWWILCASLMTKKGDRARRDSWATPGLWGAWRTPRSARSEGLEPAGAPERFLSNTRAAAFAPWITLSSITGCVQPRHAGRGEEWAGRCGKSCVIWPGIARCAPWGFPHIRSGLRGRFCTPALAAERNVPGLRFRILTSLGFPRRDCRCYQHRERWFFKNLDRLSQWNYCLKNLNPLRKTFKTNFIVNVCLPSDSLLF